MMPARAGCTPSRFSQQTHVTVSVLSASPGICTEPLVPLSPTAAFVVSKPVTAGIWGPGTPGVVPAR